MKYKNFIVALSVLLSCFTFIQPAVASGCDSDNPCGTYAMLDSSGTVTNVIVCQTSMCGGGTWDGQVVVPQVAPNKETNDPSGTGSYIGNSEQGTSVTYNAGRFFINEPSTIKRIDMSIDNSTNSTTISSVEIPVLSKSFSYKDTIDKFYGDVNMSVGQLDESRSTKISVTKISSLLNKLGKPMTATEIIQLYGQKTETEVRIEIFNMQMDLIKSKIDTLLKLLNGYTK